MQRPKLLLAFVISLLMAGTGVCAEKAGQFSLSPMVGTYTFTNFYSYARTNAILELKGGYNVTDHFGFEPHIAYSQTSSRINKKNFVKYGGDVLFNILPDGDLVPYVSVGAGGFNFMEKSGKNSSGSHGYLSGGAGLKYLLIDNLALRMEGRFSHILNETDYSQAELFVGLHIPFGGVKPAAVQKVSAVKAAEPVVREEVRQTKQPASAAPPVIAPVIAPVAETVQPAVSTSVRVAMPDDAAVAVTIPPLPVQVMTVAVKGAAPAVIESAAPAAQPAAPLYSTVVTSISVTGDYIEILGNASLATYSTMLLREPQRMAIDLPATRHILPKQQVAIARFGVTNVRIGSDAERVRIVFDTTANSFPAHRIEVSSNALRVHFVNARPVAKTKAKLKSAKKKQHKA